MSAVDIKLPEPTGHIHSNGDYCPDQRVAADEWPVSLYTEEQLRAAILADRASRTPSPQGDAEFEVWQDEVPVASASGPRAAALAEIEHYAAVYGQDGPVEVYEVRRTRIDAARSTPAKGGEQK